MIGKRQIDGSQPEIEDKIIKLETFPKENKIRKTYASGKVEELIKFVRPLNLEADSPAQNVVKLKKKGSRDKWKKND